MNKELIAYFKSLDIKKQQALIDQLLSNFSDKTVNISLIDTRDTQLNKHGIKCPYCNNSHIVGYGTQGNSKRYKCKDCSRTFSTLTGTSVSGIHKKSLLKEYVFYMLSGLSLRKITKEMDICLKTAFDWRHKLLNSISLGFSSSIDGIVEADETFFLYSEKGSKTLDRKPRKRGGSASKRGINKDHITVLTVFERKSKDYSNTVVCRGRITKKAISKGLGEWLDKSNSILCSDSHNSMRAYANENSIELKPIFVKRKQYVFQEVYHIQNVNRVHSILKDWIKKFNGVATKYLQNYLNYYKLVQTFIGNNYSSQEALSNIVEKNDTYLQRDLIKQLNCIT